MTLPETPQDAFVLLEFQPNPQDFSNPVPVRFRIGNKDLFGEPDNPWLPMMLPGFATFGMACVRLAKQSGRAALDLDEYAQELLFQMDDTHILVCSTIVRTTVLIAYTTLFTAWQTFAVTVRDTVIQRHPEKRMFDWWQLIIEEPPPRLAEQLTRSFWFEERKDCF